MLVKIYKNLNEASENHKENQFSLVLKNRIMEV